MTTEYLLHREMEHVFAALMPGNRLLCRVCVATGLRVGDVLALRTDQLAPQFWIRESKTGKPRRVNLTNELLEQLRAQAGEVWVFPSPGHPQRHRTRQAVWHDVKRASKAFRLPQNIGVHSLRKVYAHKMMEQCGGNMGRVQRALNHSDAATTMIYVMAYEVYRAKYGDGKTA